MTMDDSIRTPEYETRDLPHAKQMPSVVHIAFHVRVPEDCYELRAVNPSTAASSRHVRCFKCKQAFH